MKIKSLLLMTSVILTLSLYGCGKTADDAGKGVGDDVPVSEETTAGSAETNADTDNETNSDTDVKPENDQTDTSDTAVTDSSSAEEASSSVEEISSSQDTDTEDSSLFTALLAETGSSDGDIAVFHEEDFDGDGMKEAFALVGQKIDDYGDSAVIEGEIWFVTKVGCEKLHDTAGMGFSDREHTMTMGDTTYILFDEVYVTDMLTDVWYVKDGKALQPPFTARGQVLTGLDDEENRFRIVHSGYDSTLDPDIGMIGHTWKQYYLFYDPETGGVREYAGTTIDEAAAEMWCGRDIVKELLPAGTVPDSLFCRGNGLIVMNYSVTADGMTDFYHYIYDFTNETLVDDSRSATGTDPLPGICMPSLCPEIASYPEVPGPGDMVWYGE